MDKSADNGRQVGQWPVARPETGLGATQLAEFARSNGQMDVDLGVAHIMATGC